MASFKFSKSMMDKMVRYTDENFIQHSTIIYSGGSFSLNKYDIKSSLEELKLRNDQRKADGYQEIPKSPDALDFSYGQSPGDLLNILMYQCNGYSYENHPYYSSMKLNIEEFMENQVFSSDCDNQMILDELRRLACNKLNQEVFEKISNRADMTISSIVGPFWSCEVNNYGSVSGQDRVHPKAGLLTVRQILEFYTNADGEVDFGHFTQLKDLVNNRSMNFKKRNHWPQRQQHVPQPREWTPRQKWTPPLPQTSSVDQGQLAQLMKMVEQLSKTVETLQINDATKQAQIEAQQAQIESLQTSDVLKQSEIDALKNQIDAKTQKQQKIESLQKQLAELL